MKEHLRKLSGQTLLYGLGNAGTRVIALLLLPVYAHILAPEEYGELALASLTIALISLLLESGQRTAYFRLYYMNEGATYRRRLTGTVLLYLVIAAVLLLPLFRVVLRYVAGTILEEAQLLPLLDIVLATTFFNIGSVVPFAIFRAEQRAGQYARLAVGRALLNATLNIVAVVVLRAGVPGILMANLITSIAFFAVCLAITARDIEWKVDFTLLKRLLSFGLPHVPANAAGWILTLSDRLFLERFGNLSDVGIYAVGYSLAGGVNMMIGWFNTAWAPYAMSLSKRPDAPRVYARLLTYSMTLFAFVALGATVFSREAVQILTAPAYLDASKIVGLIAAAYLFYELYYLLSLGFDLTFKTWYPAMIIVAAGLLNVVLNLLLIPEYGMMGAASATVLSYLLMPFLVYPIVQRLYRVPYEIGRLVGLLSTTFALAAVSTWLETGSLWLDLLLAVATLAAWAGVLWLAGYFSRSEIAAARSMVREALGKLRS
jgi:O-antigen/teichoic acid export membrane protein